MKLRDLLKGYPTVLGNARRVVIELRIDEPVLVRGSSSTTMHDLEGIVEADASYFHDDHIEGTAWRLTIGDRVYRVQTRARRYGKGPNVAEMKAIVDGLRDALRKGIRSVMVKTDSRWSAHVLAGLWNAKRPHTVAIAEKALDLAKGFEVLVVCHTRTSNLALVDRAARRAAERKRKEVRAKLASRLEQIDAVMKRADAVFLEMNGPHWRANGRFDVTTDPPSCTCPGWSLRWMNVPLAGKRANRNPCVHIASAAIREGIADPDALLLLMRKANE